MKNLYEKFHDRHSRAVLRSLDESIENFDRSPLLRKLREGTLSLREFGFTAKVRLNAATHFIPFLSATEEKTREQGGWNDMAVALRGNLNEELGLEEGPYDCETDHDVWRSRFRSGVERVLNAKGISIRSIDDAETTYDVGIFYGERLKKMPAEKSVPTLAGAFTVLEGMLEKEFSALLAYIKSHVSGFTGDELKYVQHHAGHEHKHFKDAATPLLEKCMASPHIVPEVIEGIRDMEKWRTYEVLERIDMNLWKAEEEK